MDQKEPKFSKSVWILKDIKKKGSRDIIKIISRLDKKCVLFDFGQGNIMVVRFEAETIDGQIFLFIPAVNSFLKKIQLNKYYEIGQKRCFNFENPSNKNLNDWIVYVNRIKNLNPVNLKIAERIEWQNSPRGKIQDFPFDENWLDKSLPIKNNLIDAQNFFENLEDIDPDTLISAPFKILRMFIGKQIEISEPTGSIIKNYEFTGLTHNKRIIKFYVPYFLRDMVNTICSRLNYYNLLINKLKIFYKTTKEITYAGFLWDPTLSGFVYASKSPQEKAINIKEGIDLFGKLDGNSIVEQMIKEYRATEEKVISSKKGRIGQEMEEYQVARQLSEGKIRLDDHNEDDIIDDADLENPDNEDFEVY